MAVGFAEYAKGASCLPRRQALPAPKNFSIICCTAATNVRYAEESARPISTPRGGFSSQASAAAANRNQITVTASVRGRHFSTRTGCTKAIGANVRIDRATVMPMTAN